MPYRDLDPEELAGRKLVAKIVFPPVGALFAGFIGVSLEQLYWPESFDSHGPSMALLWCLAPLGFIGGIVVARLHNRQTKIRFFEHSQGTKGCALIVFLLAIFCFVVVGISSCRGVGGGGGGTKIFFFPIRR
jgi:hypothetical protein